MQQPEFLSKRSVAAFFDTSVSTIDRWVHKGILPKPITLGGTTVIVDGQERIVGGMERWSISSLIQAASGAMDKAAGTSAPSADPDLALEEDRRETRKDRQASSRGRHR